MRNCSECAGPVVMCSICHHSHCDDETCIHYPTQCAMEAQT